MGSCQLVNMIITSTPYAVLPLFATRFAACTEGIWVTFIRAISHLKWYKFVCMGYNLAFTFSQMTSINKFFMLLQSGVPRHFLQIYCGLYIEPHCFHVYVCQLTPNSSGNMQKHGYLECFHAASTRENISVVWGINCMLTNKLSSQQQTTNKLMQFCNKPLKLIPLKIV